MYSLHGRVGSSSLLAVLIDPGTVDRRKVNDEVDGVPPDRICARRVETESPRLSGALPVTDTAWFGFMPREIACTDLLSNDIVDG